MSVATKISVAAACSVVLLSTIASFSRASQSQYQDAYAKYSECREALDQRCAYTYAGEALRLAQQIFPRPSKELAVLAHSFGTLTLYSQLIDQAIERLTQALVLTDEAFGEQSDESFQVLLDLLDAESRTRNAQNATGDKHRRRALQTAKIKSNGKPLSYADNLLVIGSFLTLSEDETRVKNGRIIQVEAHEIYADEVGLNDIRSGVTALQVGKAYAKFGQDESAVGWFDRALESIESSGKPNSQVALVTHELLVTSYERMGKSRKASKHCVAVGKILSQIPEADLKPLYSIKPNFSDDDLPAVATEGYVVVKFNVSKTGEVKKPMLFDSNVSPDVQKTALNALKQFRYPPKFHNGKAVETFGVTHRFEVSPSS